MDLDQSKSDFVERLENEELYVSDVSAELEPIVQLVGSWMALEETEPEQIQPNDIPALQEKLQKQENLIHLLAKASSSLLHIYYNTKDEKKEVNPESDHLKEEIMQLTFRNSSLQEQLKEVEQQLADADHRVEDVVDDSRRLAAVSLSVDASTQEKLKDLLKENNDLNSMISELVTQLKSRDRHLAAEQQRAKKKMVVLQEMLESKDAEMAKLEISKKTIKKDIKGLNKRLVAIEVDAEELREELERNRMETAHYKSLLRKSELENAECREMLFEAKQRLNDYNERIARTKLIRHVQNPNSPYVDPDSLACEFDRVSRERNRFDHNTSEYGSITWPDDTGSIPCDDISLSALDCDTVDGNGDAYYPMNFQPPMGQPGQPGSFDLDMALDRLSLLQHWKRMFTRQTRPALTYTNHVTPRISRNLQFDCEVSTFSDLSANSCLRSTTSFPMQFSFQNSFEGLNSIGKILQSGVLIRGCEAADVFEEMSCSILDLEEDDNFCAKTDETDSNLLPPNAIALESIAWKGFDSSKHEFNHSASGLEVACNQTDIVPLPKSNSAVGRLSGITCTALQPFQDAVVQRTNLREMGSKLKTRNEMLPDCVVS